MTASGADRPPGGRVSLQNIRASDARGRPLAVAGLTAERLRASIERILEETTLCALATVTADGQAHVSTVYFAYTHRLTLYFLSHPDSQHARSLASNASAAVAVFSSAQPWLDPGRGLQLSGRCEAADARQAQRAERVYRHRFRAYPAWRRALPPEAIRSDYRFYRFVPAGAKVHDEREFGDGVWVSAEVTRQGASAQSEAAHG